MKIYFLIILLFFSISIIDTVPVTSKSYSISLTKHALKHSWKGVHQFYKDKYESLTQIIHGSDQAVLNKLASAKKSSSGTVNLTKLDAFGYSGQITIGGQKFTTLFDTGSSDLWVPWVNCPDTACKKHRRFNESLSKTFDHKYNSTKFYMEYIVAVTAKDNLQVGDIESVGQVFGLSTYEIFFLEDLQFDGIFGMAFDDISTFGAATPFSNMINQKAVNEPYFSFYLQRSKDDVGTLTLGGVDTTKFTGNLSYHKVAQYNGSYKYWMTEMDDISINGKKLNYTNKKAIFDTGVPAILMPYYDADSFHEYVNGSYNSIENIYYVPCNIKDYVSQLSFIFGGISYNIDPSELILQYDKDNHLCISGVQSAYITEYDTWVVGDLFLKYVYSVYNMKDLTIGLAHIK